MPSKSTSQILCRRSLVGAHRTVAPSLSQPSARSSGTMGGLCSKSANEADPFAQPGRLLGNSNAQAPSTPPPRKLISTTPGRTLGGGMDSTASATAADDARSAAARAAEVTSSSAIASCPLALVLSHALSRHQHFPWPTTDVNPMIGACRQSLQRHGQALVPARGTEEADPQRASGGKLRARASRP